MGAGGVGPAFQRLGHRRLRLGQDGRGGGVIQIETVGSHGRETLIDCGNGGGFYIGGLSRSASICRSEEHTSELQSLMRISYAVFCLKKKKKTKTNNVKEEKMKNEIIITHIIHKDSKQVRKLQ